jgi:hypothetical protein
MNVYLELCKNTPLFKTYYHFHMGSWWPSGYGQILKMVKLFASTLVHQQMRGKKLDVKPYNSIRDEQVELTLFINY